MNPTEKQEEIDSIAERLAGVLASIQQLQARDGAQASHAAFAPSAGWDRAERLGEVRRQLRIRDIRSSLFDSDLVGEHAWNMLLFCFAERMAGVTPTVTAVCAASHAPPTTASRHLQAMTDAGLLTRSPDPNDARRGYVELSAESEQQIHRFFDMVRAIGAATPLRSIMSGSISDAPVMERSSDLT